MQIQTIGGKEFACMLSGGAFKLAAYRQDINDLNVFPIPDGDTGDNMLMTFGSGADAAKKAGNNLGAVSKAAAEGMLLGARGNSGVILSRIFAGITSEFSGLESASIDDVKRGMKTGVAKAYGAVSNPVEGTILTVFKDAVNYADDNASGGSLEEYFRTLLDEMGRSLDRTPELLPVLAEAGVVDSGGAGLYYIFEGMKDALEKGENYAEEKRTEVVKTASAIDFSLFDENSVLEFGYCTEFLLRLQRAKTDVEQFDEEELSAYLNSVGDSVVCFKDGSIVKVHVHTKDPGGILRYCQQYGEFLTLKIENMTLQHSEAVNKGDNAQSRLANHNKKKKTGIVAVAAGKGLKETFLSLGVDEVVDGGQSMNPSAGDMIAAFDKVNAERIFVFPNNGNVILTAEQAAELYDKANVVVLKTKTIGEGYAAVSMMETEGETEDIVNGVYESVEEVVTACISKANRNAVKNGVSVVSGDYIGFVGDEIISDDADKNEAAKKLLGKINVADYGLLLVFIGETVTDEEAEQLKKELEKSYPETEVIVIEGDQPVYDYMFVLE